MKKRRVGQVADELGYATEGQVQEAVKEQERRKGKAGSAPRLGLLMVEMGIITGRQLAEVLSQSGIGELRVSEDAFQLATRLDTAIGEEKKVVLVSSARSEVVLPELVNQLGIALALIGNESVLVVDANLRHSNLHQRFHLTSSPGLSDVLLSTSKISNSIVPTGVNRLHLLPAGHPVADPLAILMARELAKVIEHLRKFYRLVIVSGPAVLEYSDAAILGSYTDGVIIPVTLGKRSKSDVMEACRVFEGINLPIIGSILCES